MFEKTDISNLYYEPRKPIKQGKLSFLSMLWQIKDGKQLVSSKTHKYNPILYNECNCCAQSLALLVHIILTEIKWAISLREVCKALASGLYFKGKIHEILRQIQQRTIVMSRRAPKELWLWRIQVIEMKIVSDGFLSWVNQKCHY